MSDSKQDSMTKHDVNEERIVLLIRFDTKPSQRDEFLRSLEKIVNIMRKEASFIDAVISQNIDQPNELLMYETWRGNRESWLRDELPRPYRAEDEQALAELVVSRDVKWFTPLTSWHSSLPGAATNRT
jgi:quinol monooxygenase YgiN